MCCTFKIPVFICTMVFILVSSNKGFILPEGLTERITVCATGILRASCPSGCVIAVEDSQYGTKPTNTCSLSNTSLTCCQYSLTDCLIPFSADDQKAACTGRELCKDVFQARILSSCGANFPPWNHYFTMTYDCISWSRIIPMCSVTSITGPVVYLWNRFYPSVSTPTDMNCSCSVEANSCASKINIYLVHMTLGGKTCLESQRLEIADNGIVTTLTCSNNTNYNITKIMTTMSNYIVITFTNPDGINDGRFWIGFDATSSNSTISINCPAGRNTVCVSPESTKSMIPVTRNQTGTQGDTYCQRPLPHCFPIPGRDSCFTVEHNRQGNNWFAAAKACVINTGRLLWLYDKNITVFMMYGIASVMRTACPNCTFMWIGLVQSTFHDDNFFWKRTQNETQLQCQAALSNRSCEFNVTKEECGLLECCYSKDGCFYAADVNIDRQHEYSELNQVSHQPAGYRRCVGLHRVFNSGKHWTFSVEICSRAIPYDHGYFCEFRCGRDWPVPTLQKNTYPTMSLYETTTDKSSLSQILGTIVNGTVPTSAGTQGLSLINHTTAHPGLNFTATSTTSVLKVQDGVVSHCTPAGWDITVDMNVIKQIYPHAKASEIYLGENSCTGTEYGNAVRFQQGFHECRTSEFVTESAIVYRNQLLYATRDPAYPFLIRQYDWTVGVECDVRRNDSAAAHVHHESSYHGVPYVTGNSLYGVNLTFYNDSNFMNTIPGNPLRVQVGSLIYVKVFTTTSDWSIKMKVHTCYTLPRDSSPNSLKFFIIKNGCEVDTNTHIISQSTHETRFVFQDFEYASNHEGLDIHCEATFCPTSDYTQQCLQTCNPDVIPIG